MKDFRERNGRSRFTLRQIPEAWRRFWEKWNLGNGNVNCSYWKIWPIIIIIIVVVVVVVVVIVVSCHRPFLPGTSLEPAVIPTAQASSVTLQYFPYYV
jgi:hypothetical protein